MIRRLFAALLLICVALPASAQDRAPRRWVTSWATAPMAMTGDNALPAGATGEITLRQSLRLSIGGDTLRLRVTNRYGTAPLRIVSVEVGKAATTGAEAAIAGTARAARFSGDTTVTVPAGADYWSDPVGLPTAARDRLAITIRAVPDGVATGHPGARTTTHISLPGGGTATKVIRWYYLSAVDVSAVAASTVAVLGDSITDGYGVKDNSDGRWTDYLAERFQASPETRHLAVANLGIGGNRLLLDGLGPNAMTRLDRDVLALSGVRHLILLIGVNDLGTLTRDAPVSPAEHKALVERMIAGYRQIVARAREAGIRVIGVPILPYGGSGYYHPDAANEADRQALNAWMRAPGNVDAVLDLDAAMRDARRPDRLRAEVDSGDGLHPSDAGYRAMAAAVPLALFTPVPQVVLTFDDLPEHGPLPRGVTAEAVARSITSTLRNRKIAHAYGFVNAAQIERDGKSATPFKIWRNAGYDLANHGWSHANLDSLGAAGFARELVANEPALKAAMPDGGWQYFRYPFLSEGRDAALRRTARQILADRGYRIAPVSLDFSDWRFNGAYARCSDAGNRVGVARLEARFLEAARASLDASRQASRAQYGRDVPLVVLLHSGAFTAHMLPRLLRLYQDAGLGIGALDTALADPAYVVSRDASDGTTDPVGATPVDTSDIDRICAA